MSKQSWGDLGIDVPPGATGEVPNSRAEGRALGVKHYFTGKPCGNGHMSLRFVSNNQCMECLRANCRKYHERHRETELIRFRKYAKSDPEGNRRRSSAAWSRLTKEQQRERSAIAYRQGDPHLRHISKTRWRKSNSDKIQQYRRKRRAILRLSSGTVTAAEWQAIKDHFGGKCLGCGGAEPGTVLTMDHVIPVSTGGLHVASNVQPLCRQCNASKGTKETDYRGGWRYGE